MPDHLYQRMASWCKDDRNRGVTVLLVLLMAVSGTVLTVLDYAGSREEIAEGLLRNGYGEGVRTEELQVEAGGKKDGSHVSNRLEVAVSERTYTKKEIQQVFGQSIQRMDGWILGENESLDRVESDLDLITAIPDEPIQVSWELDRYDVMNSRGELQEEKIREECAGGGQTAREEQDSEPEERAGAEAASEEGILVTLRAVLTYLEREEDQALYECSAMIYPRTAGPEEAFMDGVQALIKEKDADTRTEPVLLLPQEMDGKPVRFYRAMEKRGVVLLAMAVLIPILLIALDRQNKEKAARERQRQMEADYPEIVSKLTLLLGAGMTVKRAWKKIVEDACRREGDKTRAVYEEMRYTCREMESGVMESESYERFAKRCGLQDYIRLGALLSQNLRKGTKGLNDLLRLEAAQAFEERKARAKRLGEEAGTKLLMPMFLMLGVVLVIVVVPAFLSIQI